MLRNTSSFGPQRGTARHCHVGPSLRLKSASSPFPFPFPFIPPSLSTSSSLPPSPSKTIPSPPSPTSAPRSNRNPSRAVPPLETRDSLPPPSTPVGGEASAAARPVRSSETTNPSGVHLLVSSLTSVAAANGVSPPSFCERRSCGGFASGWLSYCLLGVLHLI